MGVHHRWLFERLWASAQPLQPDRHPQRKSKRFIGKHYRHARARAGERRAAGSEWMRAAGAEAQRVNFVINIEERNMKRIIQQLAANAAFLSLGAQALAAAPQQKAIVVDDQNGRGMPVVSLGM